MQNLKGGGGGAEKVVNPIFSYSVDSRAIGGYTGGGGVARNVLPCLKRGCRML